MKRPELTPVWQSYGRFELVDGKPVTWLEFDGDQQPLIDRLESGQGVFGVEIRIPKSRTGAIRP